MVIWLIHETDNFTDLHHIVSNSRFCIWMCSSRTEAAADLTAASSSFSALNAETEIWSRVCLQVLPLGRLSLQVIYTQTINSCKYFVLQRINTFSKAVFLHREHFLCHSQEMGLSSLTTAGGVSTMCLNLLCLYVTSSLLLIIPSVHCGSRAFGHTESLLRSSAIFKGHKQFISF